MATNEKAASSATSAPARGTSNPTNDEAINTIGGSTNNATNTPSTDIRYIATSSAIKPSTGVPNPTGLPGWKVRIPTPAGHETPEAKRAREEAEVAGGRKRKQPNMWGGNYYYDEDTSKTYPGRGSPKI